MITKQMLKEMPFRCDYKTDGNFWKAVYAWNEKIAREEESKNSSLNPADLIEVSTHG